MSETTTNQISKEEQLRKLNEAVLQVYNEVDYVQKQKAAGLNYTIATEAKFIALLRPAMVKAGLTVSCKSAKVEKDEVTMTGSGKQSHRVVVHCVYVFSHTDGGTLEVETFGEAKDAGDKTFAKAMTIALKYALRQSFLIETGDDPDYTPSEENALPKKPQQTNQPQGRQDTAEEITASRVAAIKAAPNLGTLNSLREDYNKNATIMDSPNRDANLRKLEGNYFVRKIAISTTLDQLNTCRLEYSALKNKEGEALFIPDNLNSLEKLYWQKEAVLREEENKKKAQSQEPDDYPG